MAWPFLISRFLEQSMVPLLGASLNPLMISVVALEGKKRGKGETGAVAQLGTPG